MNLYTKEELDKLSVMYDGDKDRDATSKIRGFLFQDYVTIMCLLNNQVKYVCSEYLEDVDVFFEDGTFEFIQVKYYPNTNPDMKDISTDLYYQYLRLQMLHSTLTAKPSLYIHRKSPVKKPTLDEMKKYINLGNKLKKAVPYPDVKNSETWLRKNVYNTNKKDTQKNNLFTTMASEESLNDFIEKYDISYKDDIKQYKEKLMEDLAEVYPDSDENGDKDRWQLILLGLAISYVQRRYMLVNPCFEQLKVDKKEFDQYMTESVKTKTEQTIVSYLVSIVCEEYGEIINNNDLSDLQIRILNLIYKNTIQWINKIGETVEGQCQLLNTFSIYEVSKIASYRESSVENRLFNIAECKLLFDYFLDYLWKIMLNICQQKDSEGIKIFEHLELFDPVHYMVPTVTNYICLKFPEDQGVDYSIILPQVGSKFNELKRKVIERIVHVLPKPGKWFFENSKLKKGKNYYDYSTANVSENPTVADLGEKSFYIECMDCIGVGEGEWSNCENCGDCIFTEKCIKEEN